MLETELVEIMLGRHNQHDRDFTQILNELTLLRQEVRKLNATVDSLQNEITLLTQAVSQETSVNQSAITLINGFAAQLAAAVAAAQAAGATPDQLTALSSLQSQVSANSTALAAAVAANTPTPAASGGSTDTGSGSAPTLSA